MLIDDLLNCKEWKQAGVIESLRARLTKAPKFILRSDFAMAVDELTHNDWQETCHKIVPLCRLPYPECWIEVAHSDRLAYRNNPSAREYEFTVKRVGWLCSQINTSGEWVTQMFWSVDKTDPKYRKLLTSDPNFWGNAPISAAVVAIKFNPQATNVEEAIGPLGPSDFAINAIKRSSSRRDEVCSLEGALTDWQGEGSFLMGTLALLNSRNVVEYTPISFTRKNKAAAKAGQSQLYDHEVISIHTRYSKRNLGPAAASNGHKFRSHFCRGHFKIRKTGVFFWSPHRRGSLTAGTTPTRPKDYEVRL